MILAPSVVWQRECITSQYQLISVCLGPIVTNKVSFCIIRTPNSKLLVPCKRLIRFNWAVGRRVWTRAGASWNQMLFFFLEILLSKVRSQSLGEMMSLQANNNRTSADVLGCLHPPLCWILLHRSGAERMLSHNDKKKLQKGVLENGVSHASNADGGQINKAFLDILRKWLRRRPRAAPQLRHCVYLERYSWGGKAKSSKAQTELQSHYF